MDSSPRLLRGGIVVIDPDSSAVLRVIGLQYNPDSLTRTLQVQSIAEGADHSDALRLKGPPIETIKLEAEMDATDKLEFPGQNPIEAQHGIYPQLSALETLVYPTSKQLQDNFDKAQKGDIEIVPLEAPLLSSSGPRTGFSL